MSQSYLFSPSDLNEGQFYPCSNNKRNIINLSSYMLSEKEINLISKGLSCIPSPDIDKTAIINAVFNLGRNLKILYFFRCCRNNYIKNSKTFVSKSNWIPTDKVIDPDLLQCISNFTSEIKSLTILKENNNIVQ